MEADMKKVDLAYAAGIFDGEGCIYIAGKGHEQAWQLRCFLHMAGIYMPQLFQFHFGGKFRKEKRKTKGGYETYKWVVNDNQALRFLEVLLPYLKLKRPQAELGIQSQKRKAERPKGQRLSDKEIAAREADVILMKTLKANTYGNDRSVAPLRALDGRIG